MIIPPRHLMSKAWLLAFFGREDSAGWSPTIPGTDTTAETFSRTGGPTALCWSWRDEAIATLGPRADATGYYCAEHSVSKMARVADGHDLALVDGRFLVDGWIAFVECLGPPVLDLLDSADLARAVTIHEPFAVWSTAPAPFIFGIAA